MAARAIAVPLSPPFPAPEIQYILDQSGTSILVSSPKYTAKANEVLATDLKQRPAHLELPKHMGGSPREPVELQDVDLTGAGLMLYTSGTTNRPVRLIPSPYHTNAAELTTVSERRLATPISPDRAVALPPRSMEVHTSRPPPPRPPSPPHPRHRQRCSDAALGRLLD